MLACVEYGDLCQPVDVITWRGVVAFVIVCFMISVFIRLGGQD